MHSFHHSYRCFTAAMLAIASVATLVFICVVATPRLANAQIVFDNGSADNEFAYGSDTDLPGFVADTFTFTSPTLFNTVVWYGSYAESNTPAFPDNFTISLFTTSGGTPDSIPFSTFLIGSTATRTDTGGKIDNVYNTYWYSSTLPSDVFLEGGTYGISIYNSTSADTDDDWYWSTSKPGTYYYRDDPVANFAPFIENDLAFRLLNITRAEVPEPGTLALLGVFLVSNVLKNFLKHGRRRVKD